MQRQNVLHHQLRGVFLIAVYVALDVKADDLVALGQAAFGPST